MEMLLKVPGRLMLLKMLLGMLLLEIPLPKMLQQLFISIVLLISIFINNTIKRIKR